MSSWRTQQVISFNFFFLTSNSYCCSGEGCSLWTFYFGSCDWVRMLTKYLARTSKIIAITGWNYAIQSTYPKWIYFKYIIVVLKYKLCLSEGKKTWQRMRLVISRHLLCTCILFILRRITVYAPNERFSTNIAAFLKFKPWQMA